MNDLPDCRTLADKRIVPGPIRAASTLSYDPPIASFMHEVAMIPTADALAPSEPGRLRADSRSEPGPGLVEPAAPARAGGTIEFAIGTPLAELERRALLATLDHCSGNKRRAAELCGVSLKTLYNRLAAYRGQAGGRRASSDRAPPMPGATR